ncbi:MAG: ChuX/HutX family heme-like substrate-binding protein [Steroidobacteraceae bacterium]
MFTLPKATRTLFTAALLVALPAAALAHDGHEAKRPSIVPAVPAPSAAATPAGKDHCATPADAARIQAKYAQLPAPLPFQATRELGLNEAVISSALPEDLSLGVDGSHFRAVWDSVTGWGEALILIQRGAHVLEVHSPLPAGEPSTRSKFFNLGTAPFSGHLRPDLLSAIHLVAIPGREGLVRGAFFYDADGSHVFGAFIGGEGTEPSAQQLAAFEKTWALVKSLPRRCSG